MAPESWTSVLLFVVLVVPGLLFDLLRTRHRAALPGSTFHNISRVVLVGVVTSGIAAVVVGLLTAWLKPSLDIRSLLTSPSYRSEHILESFALLALVLILAGTAVVAYHFATLGKFDGARLLVQNAWTFALRTSKPAGTKRMLVRVKLVNGTTYIGEVAFFSTDLEVADRELVLGAPIHYVDRTTNDIKPLDDYQRVVIMASQIALLQVRYLS